MNKNDGFLQQTATYFFDMLAVIFFTIFLLFFVGIIPIVGIAFENVSLAAWYPVLPWILLLLSLFWLAYRLISKSVKTQKKAFLKNSTTSSATTALVFENLPLEKTWGRDFISWIVIALFTASLCSLTSKENSLRALVSVFFFAVPFTFCSSWILYRYRAAKSEDFPRSKASFLDTAAQISIIVPVSLSILCIIITPLLARQLEAGILIVIFIYGIGFTILTPVFLFGLIRHSSRLIFKSGKAKIHPTDPIVSRYKPLSLRKIFILVILGPVLVNIAMVPILRWSAVREKARIERWNIEHKK